MRTAAVVPTFNDFDTVGATVEALRHGVDVVIVVDDGSTDGSGAVAESAGAQVVTHSRNQGKAAALRTGFDSVGDVDVVLMVDSDTGASAAGALALLQPVFDDEADMVIGVLPSPGKKAGLGTVRTVAAKGIKRATGIQTRAPLSGQRALRSNLLEVVDLGAGFGSEVSLTISAARAGARIVEKPAEMTHKHSGRSLAGFSHRARQGVHVVGALWQALVPKALQWVLFALTLVGLVAVLIGIGANQSQPDASPGPLPINSGVQVVVVPGWQWANDPTSSPPGASASVVTGDVVDPVAAIKSGSRNPDSEPVIEVDVEIQTSDELLTSGLPISNGTNAVVVVGVTDPGQQPALRPLVITGPGIEGSLFSPGTNRVGLVDIRDIAPTVLALQDQTLPVQLEGSALLQVPALPDVAHLAQQSETAQFYETHKPLIITSYVTFQVFLFLWAWQSWRLGRAMPSWVVYSGLMIGALPLVALGLRLADRWWTPGLSAWLVAALMACALVAWLAQRGVGGPITAVLRIMVVTVLGVGVDVATGSHLQTSGLFGTTPLIGTRYFGLNNPVSTLLLVAAVLICIEHVRRSVNRRGAQKRVAIAMAGVLAIIAAPQLGADGGGLVVGLFACTLLWATIGTKRLSIFKGMAAVTAIGVATAALGYLDHLRSPGDQTHLGRFVTRALDSPDVIIATLANRVELNLFSYGFPYTMVVPVVFLLLLLGWRLGWWGQFLVSDPLAHRAPVVAMLTTGAMFLLNDSGVVVLALVTVFVGPYLVAKAAEARPVEVGT